MRRAALGRACIAGLLALLAAACRGEAPAVPRAAATATPLVPPVTAAPSPPPATATALPATAPVLVETPDAGWFTHEATGFSISLPEGWQVQAVDEATAAALFGSLQLRDPHLAGIAGSPESIRSAALLAFAPLPQAGFTDNLSIRRIPLRGRSEAGLPETVGNVSAELEKLGFTVLSAETGRMLGGLPAAHLISAIPGVVQNDQAVELRCHQYLVAGRDDFWILGYTTSAAREAAMRPVFERSAASFTLE